MLYRLLVRSHRKRVMGSTGTAVRRRLKELQRTNKVGARPCRPCSGQSKKTPYAAREVYTAEHPSAVQIARLLRDAAQAHYSTCAFWWDNSRSTRDPAAGKATWPPSLHAVHTSCLSRMQRGMFTACSLLAACTYEIGLSAAQQGLLLYCCGPRCHRCCIRS